MTAFVETTQRIMPNLLADPALEIPLRQRAKFEGWLKIELAAALEAQGGQVRLEQGYVVGNRTYRADLAVSRTGWDKEILVMLKTVNTNFRFEGVDQVTRPITMNISGVIADVRKLRELPSDKIGYVLFPVFPVAIAPETREAQLKQHLARVTETEFDLVAQAFLERSPEWGISWYLGAVTQKTVE